MRDEGARCKESLLIDILKSYAKWKDNFFLNLKVHQILFYAHTLKERCLIQLIKNDIF